MAGEIRSLDFDSKLFGYRVGSLEVSYLNGNKLVDFKKKWIDSGFKLIYIFPTDEISVETLTSHKIYFADIKLNYQKEIVKSYPTKSDDNIIRYNANSYDNAFLELAYESGKYSRFKTDPSFSNNEFEKLYTLWIEKSISKKIATDILVYMNFNKIIGLLTYKIDANTCSIGLLAVDRTEQRKSIGKKLLAYLECNLSQIGIDTITVATQEVNNEAKNFYEMNGYSIRSKSPIFHLWNKSL